MSKKILVLTGSSRSGGNSDLLADAFTKGAEVAGHTVIRFECGHKKLRPCQACDACYSKGSACVFNDDFNELAPLLLDADMIAFVTPLYWYSFPSALKNAIDKLYSFIIGEKDCHIQEAMLLACGEISEEYVFDGLRTSYKLILEDRGWTDCGQLIAFGVNKKADILNTKFLEQAEDMGRAIK
jgi:putative NADPH-quinone reductase